MLKSAMLQSKLLQNTLLRNPGQPQGVARGEGKPGRNILAQARGPTNERAPMALTSFCPATLLPSQFTRSEKTGNIKRGVRTACDADSC